MQFHSSTNSDFDSSVEDELITIVTKTTMPVPKTSCSSTGTRALQMSSNVPQEESTNSQTPGMYTDSQEEDESEPILLSSESSENEAYGEHCTGKANSTNISGELCETHKMSVRSDGQSSDSTEYHSVSHLGCSHPVFANAACQTDSDTELSPVIFPGTSMMTFEKICAEKESLNKELDKSKRDLQMCVQSRTSATSRLQQEIKTLKEKLETSERAATESGEKARKLEQRSTMNANALKDAKARCAELDQRLQQLQRAHPEQDKILEEQVKLIEPSKDDVRDELERKLEKVRCSNSAWQKFWKGTGPELKRLKEERPSLMKQIDELQQGMDMLKKENRELSDHNLFLKTQVKEFQQNFDDRESEIQSKERDSKKKLDDCKTVIEKQKNEIGNLYQKYLAEQRKNQH